MNQYKIILGKDINGKEVPLIYKPYETKPVLEHGISGSGKSNLIESIEMQIESIPEPDRPNIVACTPEEEFGRFRKHNKDFIIIGEGGELPMIEGQGFRLGQQVRMDRLDVILNIASFDTEEQNDQYYADFLNGMFKVPQKYWKPTCYIGDEIQTSCSAKKITKARQPILNLVQRGRKRGFFCMFATQGLKDFLKDARDQCLPPTELIITSEGLKPISEIKNGDLVYTHKGRYRKVINKFKRNYTGKIYKVYSRGCNIPTMTTEEHPFYTSQMKLDWKGRHLILKRHFPDKIWKKANELSKKDWLVFPRNSETYDIDTEEIIYKYERGLRNGKKQSKEIKKIIQINKDLMVIAGLYLAEGSLSFKVSKIKNKSYKHLSKSWIRFSLGKSEKEANIAVMLVDKLKGLGFHSHINKQNGCYQVTCHSVILGKWLEENFSFYSQNKKISKKIKQLSSEKLLWLLEGYLLGDGHFVKTGEYTATSASLQLAYDIRDIALKTGFNSYVFEHHEIHHNAFNRGKTLEYKSHMIKIVVNRHTNGSTPSDMENMYLKIRKIEQEQYNGVVYNLEVQEDNSYCTRGHVVHNCTNEIIGYTKDVDNREIACELLGIPKSDSSIFKDLARLNQEQNTRFFYASGTEISFSNILFQSKDLGQKTYDDKYGIPEPSQKGLKIVEHLRKSLGVEQLSPEGQLQSEVSRLSTENGILKMNQLDEETKANYIREGYLKGWDEKGQDDKIVINDLLDKFNKKRLPFGKIEIVYIKESQTPKGSILNLS